MNNLLRDLRYSLRSLTHAPTVASAIILTVGLGIGGSTAVFSVMHAVLIEPLPYEEPERLAWIYSTHASGHSPLSVADYLALEEQQTLFDGVAAFQDGMVTYGGSDGAERIPIRQVTIDYLSLLGMRPQYGRPFNATDAASDTPLTAILSHGFWLRQFGGSESVIGRPIRLNAVDVTVIGVLPRQVGPLDEGREVFVIYRPQPPTRKGPFSLRVLGRVKPNVEAAVVAEELDAINRRIFPLWQASWPDESSTWQMMGLHEVVVGDVRASLLILFGAVGFVWLMASTNAATLMIERGTSRSPELAIRTALGASRGKLVRQLLSEGSVLATASAAVGLVVAGAAIGGIRAAGPDLVPRAEEVSLSSAVLWFAAVLTLASSLLFGVIPSIEATRRGVTRRRHLSGWRTTSDPRTQRVRRTLVISQFAVAMPLLVGASLLVISFAKLQRVDPGFDHRNVLTAQFFLDATSYEDTAAITTFLERLESRLLALPGVEAVGRSTGRPPSEIPYTNNIELEGRPTPPNQSQPAVPWLTVTPTYFRTLGIPLIEGRMFSDRDRPGTERVVLVDQTWATRFFPNESAINKRFYYGGCTSLGCPTRTVVGVVGDVKYMGLDSRGEGTVYVPQSMSPQRAQYLFIRTLGEPMTAAGPVRRVVRDLDPALAVTGVATVDDLMGNALQSPKDFMLLVTGFAGVALLLAMIGIYGVMSYFIQQRITDLGIRVALGAEPRQMVRMVIGGGMRLAGVGVVVGVASAFLLSQYLSDVLFEVHTTDPTTFVGVAAGMLVTAAVACWIPARRAAQIDPIVILREQ